MHQIHMWQYAIHTTTFILNQQEQDFFCHTTVEQHCENIVLSFSEEVSKYIELLTNLNDPPAQSLGYELRSNNTFVVITIQHFFHNLKQKGGEDNESSQI